MLHQKFAFHQVRQFCASPTLLLPHYLNGLLVGSKCAIKKGTPIYNPATQECLGVTPASTGDELSDAIKNAKSAFSVWSKTPVQARQRPLFDLHRIIRERTDELAETITREQGKTLADAKAEIARGLDVVEFACSGTSVLMGEMLSNVANNIDTYTMRQPLGICGAIAPFNFPAMIPMWMFTVACTAGNVVLLKPSEKVPSTALKLAAWACEAGYPPGVLNIVHGGKDTVDFLCTSPDISATVFVGGNKAGEHIYTTGTGSGKRVLSNMGAKNHAVIMPDCNKEDALNQLCNAAFGAAGQRCMVLSVAVFVGEAKNWVSDLVPKARQFKVNAGHEPNADLGPLISNEAKERAVKLCHQGLEQGANMLLDGTKVVVDQYPLGHFFGPTILDNVSQDNIAYKEELFAPVLCVMYADTLNDAIKLINNNPYVCMYVCPNLN